MCLFAFFYKRRIFFPMYVGEKFEMITRLAEQVKIDPSNAADSLDAYVIELLFSN